MEKIEHLEREYTRVRKALEFVMPLIEEMDYEDFKKRAFEKRKEEIIREFSYDTEGLCPREGMKHIS